MVSNPMWYCSKCEAYYQAGQPCPRCGNGDFIAKVKNYQVQAAHAAMMLQNIMTVENHTDRAVMLYNVRPCDVTPAQRNMALRVDRAIGLGQVEF